MLDTHNIPSATISRLVTYLRILEKLEASGVNRTSSDDLAFRAQVSAFQVRKDLAYFGRFGTRGMGYTVQILKRELRRILVGTNRPWQVVIVGMGRLGQAIAHYSGAADYQFSHVGLFDVDPHKMGMNIAGLVVKHMDELHDFLKENTVDMGFLTVPAECAQDVTEQLVAAGIKGILNFTPIVLRHPETTLAGTDWENVIIENVDFLAGVKRLAFYMLNPSLKKLENDEE